MLDGVEWVLFDAVGTLIYPHPPVAEAYRAAGERFGARLGGEEVRSRFAGAFLSSQAWGAVTSEENERVRWRKVVAEVFAGCVDDSAELFELLWAHFAEPRHWRTYEDVAVLAELKARGYRIGIASNFDSRLEGIVREQPLLAVCEAVFVSSSVGFSKPDERFFREVEKRLGVEAGKIALVGDDAVNDVEGARRAGWRGIGLERNSPAAIDGVIRSLSELV